MFFRMSSACGEVTSSSAIPSSISISATASSSSSSSALHNSLHGPSPSAIQAQIDRPLSKKKRNMPGNPDPDAEVIALSPKSLMAKNQFMCEICNKGFQRNQNLQLHRRGHNLPWKLKQRVNKEAIRKKVYVCPELGCVHHDRSRALGDLTGIKKHYGRKHGEKKWKCDKCSKRYAVQSDWKAHSKVCGTKEYRCDCGTLFSRRDSFITHRAFCDALAEESVRSTSIPNPIIQTPQLNPQLQHPQFISLKQEQQHLGTITTTTTATTPRWLSSLPPPPVFPSGLDHGFSQNYVNPEIGPGLAPMIFTTSQFHQFTTALPSSNMSATALLQKAAQMGATMSSCASLQDVIMPLSYGNDAFGGMFGSIKDEASTHVSPNPLGPGGSAGQNCDGNMTRDFLGLRPVSCDDFLNMAGIKSCIKEQQEQQEHQEQEIQKPWLGNSPSQ